MSLLNNDISDVISDLRFGRIYSALTLLSQGLLVLVGLGWVSETLSTPEGSVDFVKTILQPGFLIAHTFLILGSTLIAKKSTGHKRSLALPHHTKPIKGDPSKGPFIRRTVLRIKAFIFRISPIKTVLHGVVIFSLVWGISVYLIVCFGAPVFSDHVETLGFSYLMVILTTFPILLIYGPETDSFGGLIHVLLSDQKSLEKNDPLGHQLFINCCGVILGAWIGAFPIPLDWDRPWQKWPTSCSYGALAGSFLSNCSTFLKLYFHHKTLTSSGQSSAKKKR